MTEPIELERAKTHLRVVDDGEDEYIAALITAAREYAEKFQNRVFVSNDPEVEVETPGELEKFAMLLLIGHWYENREAVNIGNVTSNIPLSTKHMLTFNRRWPI